MSDLLTVPGARIRHRVDGCGPMLLLGQSGEGGIDRAAPLVALLADRFTVVSYDRRGLGGSPVDDPAAPVSMATHVDDAARLIAAVADGPVLMAGLSYGAVIGLHLAAERPHLLAGLVAHEPVAPGLLPEPDADRLRAELASVEAVYADQGWTAAIRAIGPILGIDPARQRPEPGVELGSPFAEHRRADFEHFLAVDIPAARQDGLTRADVAGIQVPVVAAAGADTPEHVLDRRAAVELAGLLGRELVAFPGGHNGDLVQPRAFAKTLAETLDRNVPFC
ncbi:alpha/beta fold hydrolase [Pseudonocardia sp. CA-107938]|uniref:alpha/beta fold hydrolase n=1 Tax=Pseudonocardia sp. CA-107938 TaxID=3240021 RepID=UPI003D912D26